MKKLFIIRMRMLAFSAFVTFFALSQISFAAVLFHDDFGDGIYTDKWEEIHVSALTTITESGGELHLYSQRPSQADGENAWLMTKTLFSSENLTVEARIKPMGKGGMWVMIWNNGDNYMRFGLTTDDTAWVEIDGGLNGSWFVHQCCSWGCSNQYFRDYHTFVIKKVGNVYSAFIDGVFLGTITHNLIGHTNLRVGLWSETFRWKSGDADNYIDYVKVEGVSPSKAHQSLADYDGDGMTDIAMYSLGRNQFFTHGRPGEYGWGGTDSMPIVWDYNGDGKTDISIYHIPSNQWFVKGYPGGNMGQFGLGGEESVPVPGDYNGDGIMERAVYHSPTNQWLVEGGAWIQFGWNGSECIPLPGDYDGDGVTDMVLYHIPSNQWFQYGVGALGQFGWGGADCMPVPGDYDGDGRTDIAVYHVPSNQWFIKGLGNLGKYGVGGAASFPIPGDYNGDGIWERGYYHYSDNWWHIEGVPEFVWGWSGEDFVPITSQAAVFNWFRFMLGKFQ